MSKETQIKKLEDAAKSVKDDKAKDAIKKKLEQVKNPVTK